MTAGTRQITNPKCLCVLGFFVVFVFLSAGGVSLDYLAFCALWTVWAMGGWRLQFPSNGRTASYRFIVVAAFFVLSLLPVCWNSFGVILSLTRGLMLYTAVFIVLYSLLREEPRLVLPWLKKLAIPFSKARQLIFASPQKYFLLALCCGHFLATNVISYFVFAHFPHVIDGNAQLFHAKMLSRGHLYLPSPELPWFFDFTHMINNGRWYSQYPPGHMFLLVPGIWAHAPWIINPIFGALSLALVYQMGRDYYGESVGRLAAILFAFCPWSLFMSSEFMNHTTTLFFLLIFFVALPRALKFFSWRWAGLAGLAWGWAFIIRPLTAIGVSLPILVVSGISVIKHLRAYVKSLLSFALGVGLFGAILAGFNWATNGSPFTFGYEVRWGKGHLPGFGHSGWGPPHTVERAFNNMFSDWVGLNEYLFQWPVPALLFIFLLFILGRPRRRDLVMLASIFSLSAAYFTYWFEQWLFGPRFLYEALPFVLLLSVRGIQRTERLFSRPSFLPFGPEVGRNIFLAAFLSFYLSGYLVSWPHMVHYYTTNFDGSSNNTIRFAEEALEKYNAPRGLFFVPFRDLTSVFHRNSPFFDGDMIFVQDLDPITNAELCDRFKEMATFKVDRYRVEPYPLCRQAVP